MHPDPTDALDSNIASLMMHDNEGYKKKAMEETKKYACRPVEEILKEVLGEAVKPDDEFYKEKKAELEKWIQDN